MTREEIEEKYSALASDYDKKILPQAGYTAHKILPEQLLRVCSPKRVVDIGCGTGISSELLLAQGISVVGVDAATGMLEEATKRSFTDLVLHDISEPLPFSDSCFDAALILGVTEFIEDLTSVLREVSRILVDKGVVAITIALPNKQSSLKHYTHSSQEVRGLFSQAGFIVRWSKKFFGYTKLSANEDVEYEGFILEKR